MCKIFQSIIVLASMAFCSCTIFAQEVPVELPAGYGIQKVAGNDLVPDASAMTVDPAGKPVVSGPGYVRRLIDGNGDGLFDSFETLAKTNRIAQGIWFDGKEMWLTVDGALKRSVSRAAGEPFVFENVVTITTGKEHGSHAIRKGPDGWWYVLCGNATVIREQYYSLASSPIKNPRAGFLMRFPADVGTGESFAAEIVCHGFRNPYDFDFNSDGEIFVYDSDGERDVSLPWYRPTRIFKVKAGDDAGWVSTSWKRPASFFDMPELVGELGRGSPTGVVVCDTRTFGDLYQQAAFVGDWTFGRIGVARPGKKVEIFAKPKGNFGFAITDLEFTDRGELLVTTGGRGTEGALYRISRTADLKTETPAEEDARNDSMKEKKSLRNPGEDSLSFVDRLARTVTCDESEVSDSVRSLQLMLGGCDGDRMFAGHQAKTPIDFSELESESIVRDLLALFDRRRNVFETARLIGMLAPKDDRLANALSDFARYEARPVKRIHYLNCLAVAGGKLNAASVVNVAESLLNVRREIDATNLPVDRNWTPRMQQLAVRLFRNMSIPEAIVQNPSFGQPSDTWMYQSLPEIFRPMARVKIAAKLQLNPDDATRQQLQCLAADTRYVDLIRTFSDRDEFTDVVVSAVNSKPVADDWKVLFRGLKSFNLTVNKASLIGLKRLEGNKLVSGDFEALLRLERQLGWTNPEISVRDQIVMLLQKWTKQSFGYQVRNYDLKADRIREQKATLVQWKQYLTKEHSLKMKATASVEELVQRFSKVDFATGDAARGKLAYRKFQCASCHDGGGQNSGPSLAGVASRFSREDVLRAIVDPNDNVPDRYRAVVVATEDGQFFRGSVVYESMAGIMLATSTGEIVRVDAADIEARRKSSLSLMPEGLLNEASDQEVADLWAMLRGMKK